MWLIYLAVILGAFFLIFDTLRIGISPMPTLGKVKRTLIALLPETQEGVIFELGSGFGTLALSLAKKYPQAKIIAYEKAIIPFLISKVLCMFQSNLQIIRQDFFQVDLTKADLLVCYLFPYAMKKLSDLPLAGQLISHTFHLPGYAPSQQMRAADLYRTPIYFYHLVK